MLMRPKKGQSVEKRLLETLDSPLFGQLRHSQPDFHRKIIPIQGDIGSEFLGISDADRSRLESKVSIVMHSAATINFTEPLRDAVALNIQGVEQVLRICKEMPKLDALVHISTAYSQVDKTEIDEKVYDPPMSASNIIQLTRILTDDQLSVLTPHLLKNYKRPNTYTLTKAIAESLIKEEHGNIPCCIVRPTVVAASYSEPMPGWVDNLVAGNGVFAGIGSGLIRVIPTQGNGSPIDVVPVDMTAHIVIAAGWYTASNKTPEVRVYNLSNEGSETVSHITDSMGKNAVLSPLSMLPPPRILPGTHYWTSNRVVYRFCTEVYDPFRCWMKDVVLRLTGRKPRMMKMYDKANKLREVLCFFTSNGFVYGTDNAKKLLKSMDESDRKNFNFDVMAMNKDIYYRNWWLGTKKFIFKDKAAIMDAQSEDIAKAEPSTTVTLKTLHTNA